MSLRSPPSCPQWLPGFIVSYKPLKLVCPLYARRIFNTRLPPPYVLPSFSYGPVRPRRASSALLEDCHAPLARNRLCWYSSSDDGDASLPYPAGSPFVVPPVTTVSVKFGPPSWSFWVPFVTVTVVRCVASCLWVWSQSLSVTFSNYLVVRYAVGPMWQSMNKTSLSFSFELLSLF